MSAYGQFVAGRRAGMAVGLMTGSGRSTALTEIGSWPLAQTSINRVHSGLNSLEMVHVRPGERELWWTLESRQ